MSDNGAAAEDDRSQIKDDGGDDEVRDGPFHYINSTTRTCVSKIGVECY